MGTRYVPVIGQWYERRDKGGLFQVVALDEELGTVDIQEFEGDVDELDLETWRQMSPIEAAAPEDWSGPVDDVEPDEFGYTDFEARALESPEVAAMTWEQVVEDDDEDLDRYAEPPRPTAHRAGRTH